MDKSNKGFLQVGTNLSGFIKGRSNQRRWLFASMVALSMLGAGTAASVGNASANTVGNSTAATKIVQSTKTTTSHDMKVTGTAESKSVDLKTDVAAPMVKQPYVGDRAITGTGTPGYTIVVYDDLKNEIGRGEVNPDYSYSIKIKPEYELFPEENISVVQVDSDGNESSPVNVTVKERIAPPTLEQPYEGATVVVGKGVPGCTVTIYNDKEDKIGEGTVDNNGDFVATINTGYNLYQGEKISAVQRDTDGNESAATSITVKPQQDEVPKPYINQPYVTDRTITGFGEVGCKVVVYNDQGSVLGRNDVDGASKFEVSLSPEYNLYEGEEIKVVQINADGVQSPEATIKVMAKKG